MAESEGQRRKDVYWPADLVCRTLPDSRVLTYGYDTKIRHRIQGPVSKKSVYDHGWDLLCSLEALRRNPNERCRPLLFVAHSLGGIVVKEALRRSQGCASTKTHFYGIFEATVGVLFFGTPHRGADPRNFFHHVLSASAQFFGVQVNDQIIDTLMRDAERLTELRDEFSSMCHERKWQVYSFQEEYGVTALFGTKVVDDQSSCLDDPTVETKQHISSNHMDMCRFSGLQDPEYSKVAAAMTFILGTIMNGTDTISREPPLACRQSQDTSPMVESNRVSCKPSIIREPPRDIPSPLETRSWREQPPTRVSYGINAAIKQSLIDQLYFNQIDERLTGLAAAQGATCRWFLTKREYTSWRNVLQQLDHGGFLWIKGNPGTGKSTLMKFLVGKEPNARGDSSQITASFFFLGQGTIEEKSTMGLYRSLLHQLFETAVDLRDSLEWMTADGAKCIQRNGWHEEALKQTLTHAIQMLGSRSLTIFVDALDECDKNQVAGMICFFEELCDRARETQVRLRICFSSRHYPTVVIQKGIEVTLENEIGHTEDIERYIKSRLRLGKSGQAEPLRSEILEKSSGIFLWVVLVLNILNAEYPNSSVSIKGIRNRLREIPPKLSDLFEMILTRDGENLERLQICLKWILFAARPLTPQELYFATQLGLDKESSSYWDQEDVELDQMKTYVRSSSKGLAEVTRNKTSEVQFIHESVRDFLLGRYGGQWSGASSNFVGHGHEILRDCCLAQLNASMSQYVDIPNTLPLVSNLAQLRETINLKFPFLQYSVLNILRHTSNAQQHGMEQGEFLADFPLSRWKFLNNALEKFNIRRYGESVSLLYILAEKNLANLIRVCPQATSCFDAGDGRYGPPIFAALATGSDEAVQALLEVRADVQPRLPVLRDLCKRYAERRHKIPQFGRGFIFLRQQRSVISYVAEQTDDIILAFLLDSGSVDVDLKTEQNRTLLCWAALNGNAATTRLLLERGADIEAKDDQGWRPLHGAVSVGSEDAARLLLERGADIEAKDDQGWVPLHQAALGGHTDTVRLLLERGADIEAKDSSDNRPLHWAASKGCTDTARLLLEKGADNEAKGYQGVTPLCAAARNGHTDTVSLLLKRGADIEAKDNQGWRPLHQAVWAGRNNTARLLLEKGADIEAKDNQGWRPLHRAVSVGSEDAARLLLERGANIETKSNDGKTPRDLATRNIQATVLRLFELGI